MHAVLDNPTLHNPEVTPEAVLCLRNIGKSYGPVQVLSQINVDVRPGEVLALLGENGAGKSTLSSIIAGLVQPEAGGSMTWCGTGGRYRPDPSRDPPAGAVVDCRKYLRRSSAHASRQGRPRLHASAGAETA